MPGPPWGCTGLSMKPGKHSGDVNKQAVLGLPADLRAAGSDLPGVRCVLGAPDITSRTEYVNINIQ